MLVEYVARGMKAGLVAGLAFGLVVALVTNPLVAAADGLAGGDHAGHGHDTDHAHEGAEHGHGAAVGAAVTNGVSVAAGVLWGLLLGAVVFGVGFYFLEPALPGGGEVGRYVLAGLGFLTVSGAPWLALPPRPPGAEQALPAETRLPVYAGMICAGALASLLAVAAYGRVRADRGPVVAAVAAAVPLALLAVPAALAPSNPVAHDLPAGLAAGFVGQVVVGQAALWLVLAAAHVRLSRRSTADASGGATSGADYAVTVD
ncbi:CbtA family protein [Halosimplex halophilum]|uniref:CbtA family protein n=1 Tax=Halosimplex halophilum TaxID=2559572 RepID=UPI00107F67BA|nr:CbtA family protein [Halosimplex halophilum]